jgi:hypothetical protein
MEEEEEEEEEKKKKKKKVYSASKRNEYQEYFLGGKCGRYIGLTFLPPS